MRFTSLFRWPLEVGLHLTRSFRQTLIADGLWMGVLVTMFCASADSTVEGLGSAGTRLEVLLVLSMEDATDPGVERDSIAVRKVLVDREKSRGGMSDAMAVMVDASFALRKTLYEGIQL